MNLLRLLSNKGPSLRFCWIPSHCGIEWNERVDQLAKEILGHDTAPLANAHYADLKPPVNSYIQQLFKYPYLLKPTLVPTNEFRHLTRAEEFVITRLRIIRAKITKSHILSGVPPTTRHQCGQTLTIDHMILECAVLQESRDEYYTAVLLYTLLQTIPQTCTVEFLGEAGFFYLIWMVRYSINIKQLWNTSTYVGRLICPERRATVKQMQSNSIHISRSFINNFKKNKKNYMLVPQRSQWKSVRKWWKHKKNIVASCKGLILSFSPLICHFSLTNENHPSSYSTKSLHCMLSILSVSNS